MKNINNNQIENFYREQYVLLHEKDFHYFAGYQTVFLNKYFSKLMPYFNIKTILDYGCGKGYQYISENSHKLWRCEKIYLYDIGVYEFSVKPDKSKTFDCVLCLDVMEHLREEDIEYYLQDIIFYAEKLAVFSISTRPAGKTLPNGMNAHLTVKPIDWWNNKFIEFCSTYKVKSKIIIMYELESDKEKKKVQLFYINFDNKEIEEVKKFEKI
ncbi:MAG: class I SAM-dependent methyltransferase [Candidatus Dojkabacteria bacterium]|nr:class I SAM-dependent methyltransferase [Candidatus Dojkabacteria bacterium]